ncbi:MULTISPECIES: helix-turn-helix transcriptional regulator [Spirulina sp. CCY15215]|uniref:helix-turn-helix domain-containing protein n=1 Tax=Spirulina sp. CCY15215 TaxID=2767591 RepID=UPI001950D968|nr:helix-turn-helix transcriptional regulator [Spirulina major]
MKKTSNAVQILNRKFCKDSENREKVEQFSLNIQAAELIYEARTTVGITQQQLADRIGTKQSMIARLESADYEGHSLKMLQKIASALNKEVCILFQDIKTDETKLVTK